MKDFLGIWYVSAQRLCNFDCAYCCSIGAFAKSKTQSWTSEDELAEFRRIVRWIGSRPVDVGVRLATLGEPFTSKEFLAEASWLTTQPRIRFVELLTNGSLVKRRLPQLAATADLTKLSLWITFHHTEISVEALVENARFAQDQYGCFVVVNALAFPDNLDAVNQLRSRAIASGLRVNVDLGYDIHAAGHYAQLSDMVPLLRLTGGRERADKLGAQPDLLAVNVLALSTRVHGQPCSAGHDFVYLDPRGNVYRCSRYKHLERDRLGNVLDPAFRLELRGERWAPCGAPYGCCNKEDYLHLEVLQGACELSDRSLGWILPRSGVQDS